MELERIKEHKNIHTFLIAIAIDGYVVGRRHKGAELSKAGKEYSGKTISGNISEGNFRFF